jgi:hypothetical protein
MESSLLKPPALHGHQPSPGAERSSEASRSSLPSHGSSPSDELSRSIHLRRRLSQQPATVDAHSDTGSYEGPDDVVSRGLISLSEADDLFNRFLNHYMVEFPLVVFPAGTTSEDVRSSNPTLFLAIIAAASGSSDQTIFRALNVELLQEFAEKVMIRSTKCLELVQAMLVMAAWYFPPDRFEDLKHYQYIHMAATMAMDIGLSDAVDTMQPSASRAPSLSHGSPASVEEANTGEVEKYRTILSCYLLCAG